MTTGDLLTRLASDPELKGLFAEPEIAALKARPLTEKLSRADCESIGALCRRVGGLVTKEIATLRFYEDILEDLGETGE